MRSRIGVGVVWVAITLLSGCGSSVDDENSEVPVEGELEGPSALTVSGTVEVLPEARRWLTHLGVVADSLEGQLLRLEDPLRATLSDPQSRLGEQRLPSNGAFSVTGLWEEDVSIALTGLVAPEGAQGDFMPFSTVLYDTGLTENPLEEDIVAAVAYALPRPYVAALSEAITFAEVSRLTGGAFSTLEDSGFILGEVLDAQGQPRPDVRILTFHYDGKRSGREDRIHYPAADYAPLGTPRKHTTRANGLFAYVHAGSTDEVFLLGVENKPEYPLTYAIARRGMGLWVTLRPSEDPVSAKRRLLPTAP